MARLAAAALACVLLLAACAAAQPAERSSVTPNADRSATPSPAPTPGPTSASPTNGTTSPLLQPTASVIPTGDPSPALQPLRTDGIAIVTVDGLRLRADPSATAPELGRLVREAEAFVISGPVAADGYGWYEVAGLGVPPYGGCEGPYPEGLLVCPVWYGWAAGTGPAGEPWLQSSDEACPSPPAAVGGLIPPPPLRWVSCLGGSTFTLRAFVPDHSALAIGCTTWPGFTPAWLGPCQFAFLADAETPDPYLYRVHVDPDLGRACTDGTNCAFADLEGQWVAVTAHFDDPEAATCRGGAAEDAPHDGWREKGAAELVLMCRQALVVTDIRPAGP